MAGVSGSLAGRAGGSCVFSVVAIASLKGRLISVSLETSWFQGGGFRGAL